MKAFQSRGMTGEDHRWPIFRALLLVSVLGGVGFIAINLLRGVYLVAAIEIAMVSYALLLLALARPGRNLNRLILAYLIPFLVSLLAVLVLVGERSGETVFIWVLLIPILSHLLLGRRRGLWVALLFLGAAGVIFFATRLRSGAGIDVVDVLNVGVCSLLIVVFSNIYERSRERVERNLLRQAVTDSLTGLVNRRGFLDAIQREHARARRHGQPLSLLLVDLDHFKAVNDQYGHEAGDAVLVALAELLNERLRESDLAARFGGEEFVIMLPATTLEQARQLAEQLRLALSERVIRHEQRPIRISMSVGAAEAGDESVDALISRADRRLYLSKNRGRNRVTANDA